jgi:hypothetical protein
MVSGRKCCIAWARPAKPASSDYLLSRCFFRNSMAAWFDSLIAVGSAPARPCSAPASAIR